LVGVHSDETQELHHAFGASQQFLLSGDGPRVCSPRTPVQKEEQERVQRRHNQEEQDYWDEWQFVSSLVFAGVSAKMSGRVSAKMSGRPARKGFLPQANFSTDFLISQLTKARFRKFLSEISAISNFLSATLPAPCQPKIHMTSHEPFVTSHALSRLVIRSHD